MGKKNKKGNKNGWMTPVSAVIGVVLIIVGASSFWSLETRVDNLEASFDRNFGILIDRINGLADRINGLETSSVRAEGGTHVVSEGKSPVTLTAKGRGVAQDLDVHAWADSVAGTLPDSTINQLDFQLDRYALRYVVNRLTESTALKIADYAYQNGYSDYAVMDVYAIALRDTLITERENHFRLP